MLAPESGGQEDVGCAPTTCPNLIVPSVEARVESDQVVVESRIENTGGDASRATTAEVSVQGWTPQETRVRALKPTDSVDLAPVSLQIPEDAGGTSYTVTVTVDSTGTVGETAEDDNTGTDEVFVPAGPRPDLVVRAEGAPTVQNDAVVLGVVVTNRGDAAASATTVAAAAPGWSGDSVRVRALEIGEDEPVELRLTVPPDVAGAQVLTVTVDPDDLVVESLEDNNSVPIRAVLPEGPTEATPDFDLSSPRATVTRNAVVLRVVVRNIGEAQAPATRVEASAAGWKPVRADVPPLAGSALERLTIRVPIPDEQREARHEFTLTVDPTGLVRETSERNNVETVPATVPRASAPDLTVRLQGTPQVGEDEVVLTAMVRNTGDAAATATSVEATAPGWEPTRADIDALNPGGRDASELRLAIPEDAPATDQEFVLTVDPDDELEEGSEANNQAAATAAIPVRAADDGGVPLWPFVAGGAALLLLGAAFFAVRALSKPLQHRRAHMESAGEHPDLVPEVGASARTVNTGFAPAGDHGSPLAPNQTLECGNPYAFWLDVGEAVTGSIELVPTPLPDQLPADTTLKVALFSLDGGLELDPDLQVRQLHVGPDGSERLFFPLRTPDEPGAAQLRCSIYHGQTLVQSRLIRAQVTREAQELDGALESVVDYTLAPSLDPAHLQALPRHRLSVMLNRNADGTHGFSFVGEEDFKSEASFGELELQDHVLRTRGALRQAAWGDEESWEKQKRYLYEDVDLARLRRDLITLAVRGFRVYAAISSKLSGGEVAQLNELMREPGFVQIASKESPRHLLPTALIYDYMGFDTTARDDDYALCPAYAVSTESGTPLENTACFKGDCPSRGEATVVCPSGFWGFRHALGVPVSVLNGADAAPAILPAAERALTVAVSTDPEFILREQHEIELRDLFRDYGWNYASTRADTLRLLKENRSQIVYFYCHGGVQGGTPYIQVGPIDEQGITADLLFSQGIRWIEPRPLVFINGCRTTALEPEKALEFVSPLVQQAGAAGVIGTEITVFEPLARVFARECLSRFLAGTPIGEAVRCARLALLREGNPLGLVYVPFVLAGLRLAA